MVWYAGELTGFRYEFGCFIGPQSEVKSVLYDDPFKSISLRMMRY